MGTEWLDTKVEQRKIENERLQIENKENDKAAAVIIPKVDTKPVVIVPEQKESEITKDQRLETPKEKEAEQKIEDDKAKRVKDDEAKRIKDEEAKAFRDEVQSKQLEQERVSTHSVEEQKVSDAERVKIKKKKRERKIAENMKNREREDAKATKLKMRERKERAKRRRYPQNPGDTTDYDTWAESEEEDVAVLLPRFHKIATMGQLFFRHAGSRHRNKPQDRVVKVSFDHDGKPKEISWGSGSRHIFFRDIMYISWGHYTPVFNVRKDVLDSKKCFSIIAVNGQTLDLEGYSVNITELWVKGLRKLKGHTDDKSDKMAKKNLKNLLDATKEAKKAKENDKRKVNEIMRLQQDLFIMSYHTVFRHLEEERIWSLDQSVRDSFPPQKMYQIALKEDIPWRRWQHWIREQVTSYLRDNGLVHTNYGRQSVFGVMDNHQIKQIRRQSQSLQNVQPIYNNMNNPYL